VGTLVVGVVLGVLSIPLNKFLFSEDKLSQGGLVKHKQV
jgi:hypothetical protein